MDRISLAVAWQSVGPTSSTLFRAVAIIGLAGLLAGLTGCKAPGSSVRHFARQVRPLSDTDRLVRNAIYLQKSGRPELAVKELEEAHANEPDNLTILDVLIQCYETLGEFKRAQELYAEAEDRGLSHPALDNNRCYSWFLAGRLDQAETCFRKLLARQPDNHAARNNLGLLLCRTGREPEALALWRETLDEAGARQRLEQALASLGRGTPPNLAQKTSPRVSRDSGSPNPTVQPADSAKTTLGRLRGQASGASSSGPDTAVKPSSSPAPISLPLSPPKALTQEEKGNFVAPTPGFQSESFRASPKQEAIQPLSQAASVTPMAADHKPPASASPYAPPRQETRLSKVPTAGHSKVPVSAPMRTGVQEFKEIRIELKNGTGVKNQAREWRTRLIAQGFSVVDIGNHFDFGLRQTIIAYRPEAARAAQELAQKFFPRARLEEGGKISPRADIRVSLGHDHLQAAGLSPKPLAYSPGASLSRPVSLPPEAPPAKDHSTSILAGKVFPQSPSGALPKLADFVGAHIEIRNGNGVKNQAREWRNRLKAEGFSVIDIDNHYDFGLRQTTIAYRPEAARVARELARKFFPQARLEENGHISSKADIRLSLGLDLILSEPQISRTP